MTDKKRSKKKAKKKKAAKKAEGFDVVSAIENDELVSREDNPLPKPETKADRRARLAARKD